MISDKIQVLLHTSPPTSTSCPERFFSDSTRAILNRSEEHFNILKIDKKQKSLMMTRHHFAHSENVTKQ